MQDEASAGIPSLLLPYHKRRGRYAGLMVLLILLLLLGGAALYLRQQGNATTQALPTTIHWQEVLRQQQVDAVVAAPGDPATLYACSMRGSFQRSSDAGMHWQAVQTLPADIFDCSIAVNPDRATDLYVSGIIVDSHSSVILRHSSNGGQTWITISAKLTLPNGENVAWAGSTLSYVGTRLFAYQDVQNIAHIISSVDGGRNWTVLDTQITGTHRGVNAYSVDPADPNTIYALVGTMVITRFTTTTLGTTPTPVPSPISFDKLVRTLYKTTDGGQSWRVILTGVPYGSSLRLASGNRHILYVLGRGGATSGQLPMQRSADGGDSWQTIPVPSHARLLNNWMVGGASGLLYNIASEPPGTAETGTPKALVATIQRYDPGTRQWSSLSRPPGIGILLAITTSANGDVLWLGRLFEAGLYRGTF